MLATKAHESPNDSQLTGLTTDSSYRLRDLSNAQWKSGAAAWLGWMFDGLDLHLYTLVATPFVAELLGVESKNPLVGQYSAWIQAAFLLGWALGGTIFGQIGDRLGRSRALILTILTYAVFTGLGYFAQTWWQLLIFRFLAALGIGGEWAVGAALLAETWPVAWRPWLAAILQSGVNLGVIMANFAVFVLAAFPPRTVFLVGILPAFLVLWIRRAVPEPKEWHLAKGCNRSHNPGILDLFQGTIRKTTILAVSVCALSLTGHWAFMFWSAQQLRNLPDLIDWTEAARSQFVSQAMTMVMVMSILGNFLAAALSRKFGYRRTIVLMSLAYFASMAFTYLVPRSHQSLFYCLGLVGLSQGVFAPFSMYLPPLYPTLLRTTGAGFCFNVGRIAAAAGTIFFGLFSHVGDYRQALLSTSFLFILAAFVALFLPESTKEK